jgi:hypothetical protein
MSRAPVKADDAAAHHPTHHRTGAAAPPHLPAGAALPAARPVTWKATYASADPAAAQRFAVDYLGARAIPEPHPGGNGSCGLLKWVVFDGSAPTCRDAGAAACGQVMTSPPHLTSPRLTAPHRIMPRGAGLDDALRRPLLAPRRQLSAPRALTPPRLDVHAERCSAAAGR